MNPQTKHIYDLLAKAGWLEQITEKSDSRLNLHFTTGKAPMDHGKFKLMLFAKLYRELLNGGMTTQEELRLIVEMGFAFASQEGWEMS